MNKWLVAVSVALVAGLATATVLAMAMAAVLVWLCTRLKMGQASKQAACHSTTLSPVFGLCT
jgi:hypothetical protein